MQVLVYIAITDEPKFQYEVPLLKWTQNQDFAELYTLDFDNHSENFLVEKARQILDEAARGVIYIDIASKNPENPPTKLGGIPKFMKTLLQKGTNKFFILINGYHPMLEKLVNAFPQDQIKKDLSSEEGRNLIYDRLKLPHEG